MTDPQPTDADRRRAAAVAPHSPACEGWRSGGAPQCICGAADLRPAIAQALADERARAEAIR